MDIIFNHRIPLACFIKTGSGSDPFEADDERNMREWKENAARVAIDPSHATNRNLLRAAAYLQQKVSRMRDKAQNEGIPIDAEVIGGYEAEAQWYLQILQGRTGWQGYRDEEADYTDFEYNMRNKKSGM